MPAVRALPEGRIDPWLKTITLARGGKPLVRLHYYATHPQTFYGDGRASSDMAGDAREALQRKEGRLPDLLRRLRRRHHRGQVQRRLEGMPRGVGRAAPGGHGGFDRRHPLAPAGEVRWRTCPLRLPPRTDPGFSLADSLARMKDPKAARLSRLYAGGVRAAVPAAGRRPIEVSCLQIGKVYIVHLPGEPMIDFQLFAQRLKPDAFVAVAGYGDCGPGYICPERAFAEGGYEPTASNVKPESEALLKKALATVLGAD